MYKFLEGKYQFDVTVYAKHAMYFNGTIKTDGFTSKTYNYLVYYGSSTLMLKKKEYKKSFLKDSIMYENYGDVLMSSKQINLKLAKFSVRIIKCIQLQLQRFHCLLLMMKDTY